MTKQDALLVALAAGVGAWVLLRKRSPDWVADLLAIDAPAPVEYAGSAAASLIESAREWVSGLTRGERNNNPGNLRRSADQWQGLAPVQSDPAFFVFVDPVAGVRAMVKTLRNYGALYGLSSVTQLISRWAPGHENPTAAYISNVAQALGVPADTRLNLDDPATLRSLAAAIIRQENGRVSLDPLTIDAGVRAALA